MAIRRRETVVGLGLVAVIAVALTASLAGGAGASWKAKAYQRSDTLITSGSQWGNIAGMNPYVGNYATGMVGLVNETLLRYDPLKDVYINWLASSAKWTGANQFTLVARPGVKWADGKAFTGSDVAFNFNLGRYNTSFWNNLWVNLKQPIKVHGQTVVFNFKSTPNYVQWMNPMWNLPMISPAQARGAITTAADLTTYSPKDPLGTGAYQLDPSGYDPTTRVVWVKKAHWWAADKHLSPSPKPKYIVDLVNTSNTNALSRCPLGHRGPEQQLPARRQQARRQRQGAHVLPEGAVHALREHGMAGAEHHAPAAQRSGVPQGAGDGIDVNKIVTDDYGHLVLPASPSGLLPTWKKYDQSSPR